MLTPFLTLSANEYRIAFDIWYIAIIREFLSVCFHLRQPYIAYLSSFSQQVKKSQKSPDFGLLFDIDGVIIRGKRILPSAPEAFHLLVDENGRFRVPTVFVTNAGNALRSQKAEQLSEWLQVKVSMWVRLWWRVWCVGEGTRLWWGVNSVCVRKGEDIC